MTAPTPATAAQTRQLLVLLYEYVVAHAPSHSALVLAVPTLRSAAQLYGRQEIQRAFDTSVAVFRLLEQVRLTSPGLPVP
jgi:hypothetical protein